MWRTEDPSSQPSNAAFEEATGIALNSDAETTVLSHVGDVNSCEVWLRGPNLWFGATVRLYGILADARVLLVTAKLNELDATGDGAFVSTAPISVRGRPVTSFEVTLQRPAGVALTGGAVYLQVWQDPHPAGLNLRKPDREMNGPARGVDTNAFALGWDYDDDAWRPIAVDATGRLNVMPVGTHSPADNLQNPPAVLGAAAFNMTWDGSVWRRARSGHTGAIASVDLPAVPNVLMTGTHFAASPPTPLNGGASALQVDGRGALFVVNGRPSASSRDAPSVHAAHGVDKSVVKAAAGNLLAFDLTNNHTAAFWLHIFNKATTPANGDLPIWRAYIAVRDGYRLDNAVLTAAGIYLSSGISWALSTTRQPLALLGGTPDVCVNAIYV